LALALLLAGCTSVPTSGPVEHHQFDAGTYSGGVRVAALPPMEGATQALIVEGFLHAMSVYEPDYATARMYLTEAASRSWDPGVGAQVYGQVVSEDVSVLVAEGTGRLDANGTYHADTSQIRQDFQLVQDDADQWRISNPPEGLLISQYLFTSGHVAVNLHYQSASSDVMVPDPVWIPDGDDSMLRALRRQFAEPSEWVAALVDFIPGVEVLSATAAADLVTIELGGTAIGMGDTERSVVAAQLALTCAQFGSYTRIAVTANGSPWLLAGYPDAVVPISLFAGQAPISRATNPELYAVSAGDLVRVGAEDKLFPVGKSDALALAVSADRSRVATVSADGATVAVDADVVRTGAGLLRPAYSRFGELWTVEASGLASLQVTADSGPLQVGLPDDLPQGAVQAFSIAPDASRVAVAIQTEQGPAVGLLRVGRGAGEITLDGWLPVGLSLQVVRVLDVGWSQTTELVLLVAGQNDATWVLRSTQDSARISDIGPSNSSGLVELAAAPGYQTVVRTAGGTVYHYDSGSSWTLWLTGLSAVGYAG
jgi:hypothetical protein